MIQKKVKRFWSEIFMFQLIMFKNSIIKINCVRIKFDCLGTEELAPLSKPLTSNYSEFSCLLFRIFHV